jgi:transcription elongation factor SPT5
MTPGAAPSPYNPHTPGSGHDQQTTLQQEWQTTDIEVRIRDTHDDAGLSGQTGVIRGISVSYLIVLLACVNQMLRSNKNKSVLWFYC